MKEEYAHAIFGGGCFWCAEAVFKMVRGIMSITPGYAGGTTEHPNYEQVCTGKTGHAEVVDIEYDPSVISYQELLAIFFEMHNPTTVDRQGTDKGSQYRSIILYTSLEQKKIAKEFISVREAKLQKPIVTDIRPLTHFYPAEEYHHNHYEKNPKEPYCTFVIDPKLRKVQESFPDHIKKEMYAMAYP